MSTTIPRFPVGMVFGVFDGLHDGHQHFLTESAKHCQKLIVVVAHPEMVRVLKKRVPHHTPEERIQKIRDLNQEWEVVLGDRDLGTWSALKTHRPEVVFLGYDQIALGKELETLEIQTLFVTAHHPHKYKSSLLLTKKVSP